MRVDTSGWEKTAENDAFTKSTIDALVSYDFDLDAKDPTIFNDKTEPALHDLDLCAKMLNVDVD